MPAPPSETELTTSLRTALSGPPAKAGERLLSERRLADKLNVSHARLRRSIRELVEEGVLVQRRGDGTYIRRLPAAAPEATASPIRTEMLLHNAEADTSDPLAAARQLTIGLWWDAPSMMTPVQQAILAGMIDRVEARGHQLALHHVRRTEGALATSADFADTLQRQGSDGYLVPMWRAEAFEPARASTSRPILYFGGHMRRPDRAPPSPHVLFDFDGAWQQALEQLEDAGCRRVLMAHIDPSDGPQAAGLRDQMRRRRLPTELLAFEPTTPAAQIRRSVMEALDGDRAPEGLLIGDDHLLPPIADLLRERGLTPGRDLAVITFNNRGQTLPHDLDWTRFELDVSTFGAVVADTLMRRIEDASHAPADMMMRLHWHIGQTHTLTR